VGDVSAARGGWPAMRKKRTDKNTDVFLITLSQTVFDLTKTLILEPAINLT
jgi:hypothetical protein